MDQALGLLARGGGHMARDAAVLGVVMMMLCFLLGTLERS
jgi:hypothetical protein